MKALIYNWNSYFQTDLYYLCTSNGISYTLFDYRFHDRNQDESFIASFSELYSPANYDLLISINYWPLLAEACHQNNLIYVAWCYDCPLNVENIEDTLNYPSNKVFLFDRNQFLKYDCMGFETVYYLPLGVCKKRVLSQSYSNADNNKYMCDISFVGTLYESQFSLISAALDDYMNGYLSSIIDAQTSIYGSYIIDKSLSESVISQINSMHSSRGSNLGGRIKREAVSFALASEVTRRNRLVLLNLFSKYYDVKLYSNQTFDVMSNIKQCGRVNYFTEMPKVFHFSKINLNPSLRIIETGIPLRAFDIMGYGGFLLSNYQSELAEYYNDGDDLVLYDSYEDAFEKASFYLKREDIRQRIALSGCQKTLDNNTLEQRFSQILSTL